MAPCGTTHFQVCGLQLYGQCKRQELISKEIMFTFNHWYILFVGNKIIKEVMGVILSTWLVFIFIFIFFRFPISLSSSFFSPCADFPKQCELDFDFLDEGRCQEIATKTQEDWVQFYTAFSFFDELTLRFLLFFYLFIIYGPLPFLLLFLAFTKISMRKKLVF